MAKVFFPYRENVPEAVIFPVKSDLDIFISNVFTTADNDSLVHQITTPF